MNIIVLHNNKIKSIQDRTLVLQNEDMRILEECDDASLRDKMAYWGKVINPEKDPTCHLRYEKNGIKVYDYDYE